MRKTTLIQKWKKEGLINDKKVLDAFKKVKREEFVLKYYKKQVYEDIALPIGWGATISQPTTVMLMTQELDVKDGDKVLEIGTGSGYQAALLSILVGKRGRVYTTEIIPELVEFAKQNLEDYNNVEILSIDGSKGYKEKAPFDKIVATAALPKLLDHLIDQLKDPGIFLAPIGDKYSQEVIKVVKKKLQITKTSLGYFQFVPLKGKHGFS